MFGSRANRIGRFTATTADTHKALAVTKTVLKPRAGFIARTVMFCRLTLDPRNAAICDYRCGDKAVVGQLDRLDFGDLKRSRSLGLSPLAGQSIVERKDTVLLEYLAQCRMAAVQQHARVAFRDAENVGDLRVV